MKHLVRWKVGEDWCAKTPLRIDYLVDKSASEVKGSLLRCDSSPFLPS